MSAESTTSRTSPGSPSSTYYRAPGRTTAAFNRLVGWLARRGLSLQGSAELSVRGRKSGQPQRLPVNPLPFRGEEYLVSARGTSQWVRNMRAAGGGELRLGRRVREFTATEVPDAEKPEILRVYLKRWGWEVGEFFRGVTAESSDATLLAAAPDHPVFRITVKDAPR
ncbi:nitroreductase family deazaflavin-dependent oxidoreductase [Streptomyces sp. NA04227]|uniref:nitroreductase family deazaflavin-dependent oxidoreductase n=1 Tax=Streptomyces sp. NA04227 TaxID=2742136 RepID=UPI0015922973|nr:nitroreductase family deazaflavin-dependent oxidoreductase [Streptomyces sp. NA04227]QKW05222.1 nitroreductase family deazaflavin-dependent oxidoreductase [Streptomyces sp. NA04227]